MGSRPPGPRFAGRGRGLETQFAAYLGSFPLADDANLLKRRARRRLGGAIALVVLIVAVLPVILGQQPKPLPPALTGQIPGQDGGPFRTQVLPPLEWPPAARQKDRPTRAAND